MNSGDAGAELDGIPERTQSGRGGFYGFLPGPPSTPGEDSGGELLPK